MGLLEYIANFYNAEKCQNVVLHYSYQYTLQSVISGGTCPLDYKKWLTNMYCHFGSKWSHLGPMWSNASVEQDGSSEQTKT